MAIIAKYKFNSSLCADYLPTFNKEFTGYIKTDVTNSDGTITRTISHDTLKPTFMRFGVSGSSATDREKSLLEVIECDTSEVTNMAYMFNSCSSLTSLDLSNFDTSKVTNFDSIFENCTSLATINVSSWDTSKVTNMAYMFNNCNKLTSLDVSNFNTSQVTSMFKMFQSCSSLTSLYVSNFNTSKVTNISNMFMGCKSLTSLDLSNFDTSNVTTMQYMFNNCSSLTLLDLSNFDTSQVTNMAYILSDCTASDIGLLYATSATINSLVTKLGTSTARNIYYTDAPLNELTVQDNITYKKYEMPQATFPYTLNKLPNGVADYIDVVNKVHVQRIGRVTFNGTETERTWIKGEMHSNNPQKDNLSRFYYGGGNGYNDLKTSSSMLSDKLPYANVTADRSEIESVGHMGNAYFNIIIRKDRLVTDDADGFKTWLQSNPITILHELATPIYTPLTEEEIAQLPLSAYADGYVNLSSDQLTPSFEFRMRASNRYQVDMLETGYYYLNAPVGNVKLGTANVDVQQMPCIVKVDNVGSGDSGYRLGFSGNIMYTDVTSIFGGFITINGTIITGGDGDSYTDFIKVKPKRIISATTYIETPIGRGYGVIIGEYDSNKNFIKINTTEEKTITTTTTDNTYYIRVSYRCGTSDNIKKIKIGLNPFITLAKLPSHRIPTSFTQGMKCGTDFGYWEGIKGATGKQLYVNETNQLDFTPIELNRIEYNNTIVEDEFDIATGKLIKRIGVKMVTVEDIEKISNFSTDGNTYYCFGFQSMFPNWKSRGIFKVDGINYFKSHRQTEPSPFILEFFMTYIVGFNFDLNYSRDDKKRIIIDVLSNTGGFTVYYELQVPEISYISLSANQVKTVANSTIIQSSKYNELYLNPQVKPSHLTYPVPSLVGNRTYTVVHNRKNISGSTKPIELNLGGTVVQLNDASSKTLVKTPSTLAHSNLIFIGGESTVDHIMVLDGDWTNKPIEYFENMKGHDTDAIITIIGDSKIDDVAEQYLW